MSLAEKIIEVLPVTDALSTEQLAEKLDHPERITLSKTLGNMRRQGAIEKDSDDLWYIPTIPTQEPVNKSANDSDDTRPFNGRDDDSDVEPFPLASAFDALEKQLEPLEISTPGDFDTKLETLRRLSLLLDPSIAAVLDGIYVDICQLSSLATTNNPIDRGA